MTKKRYSIHIFLTGFIGYMVGTIGYSLMGGENRTLYYLSSFISASVISFLYYFYSRKKYKNIIKEIEREQNDERGQIINGKTSSYTLILTMILSLSIFLYSLVKGYELVSIIIGVSYIITWVFYLVLHLYLEKVN
ncbi:hypothetical protein LZ578_02335 [Jeotgalibaca sp. MA1X17-3]|uniref:hypothetical protein n=1 Tax=Jeotgalibaca sp. MA1X17-3 TaxID=2908211 RepID=UPI001F45D2EB|nr:hypothetical protein [Jeotgalibaca sp. MA1X17-3]UJF16004.1 hypothetical protein LZ578_02335 [Jeotgalibaca sp. MA1X17-3]